MTYPAPWPRQPLRTDPAARLGTMAPDTKMTLVAVALDLAWIWADGFDWHKLAMGALALAGGWLAPSWRPPRSTADQLVGRLRPGDPVGPVDSSGGRRFIVTTTGGDVTPPR